MKKQKEEEASQDEENLEEITPTISFHGLDGVITSQNINIERYIKKNKATMLIDFGSTHNFIKCKVAKDLNCFVYPTPEFQDCRGRNHQLFTKMT